MSQGPESPTIDLIRWTFTTSPDHRAEIEAHLVDLGLEVVVHDDALFVVNWEEPDRNVEEVIEEIWDLNGEPFDVTQEDLHRVALHTWHHVDNEPGAEAA
jgi:hypothetical protein